MKEKQNTASPTSGSCVLILLEMEIDKYEQAKHLREKIDHLNVKMNQIRAMKERKDDEQFNMLRGLAFDGCEFAVTMFEQKFKEI